MKATILDASVIVSKLIFHPKTGKSSGERKRSERMASTNASDDDLTAHQRGADRRKIYLIWNSPMYCHSDPEKHPVTMNGYAALNIVEGTSEEHPMA